MPNFEPKWENILPVARRVVRMYVWTTLYLSIDKDDLLQEAWIVFFKCLNSENKYENEKHFASFYQSALKNRIIDITKNKQHEKNAVVQYSLQNEDGECYLENKVKAGDKSDFQTKLKEAPEEIKLVLTLLRNYPQHLVNLNRITNKRLCEMLGFNYKKRNLINELKAYFKKGDD